MIHGNDTHRKRGGALGAVWIVLAVIVPVIVVGTISWMSHGSNNPTATGSHTSNNGGR
jgi:hypothetical protein